MLSQTLPARLVVRGDFIIFPNRVTTPSSSELYSYGTIHLLLKFGEIFKLVEESREKGERRATLLTELNRAKAWPP